jgi:hypothetical protein
LPQSSLISSYLPKGKTPNFMVDKFEIKRFYSKLNGFFKIERFFPSKGFANPLLGKNNFV